MTLCYIGSVLLAVSFAFVAADDTNTVAALDNSVVLTFASVHNRHGVTKITVNNAGNNGKESVPFNMFGGVTSVAQGTIGAQGNCTLRASTRSKNTPECSFGAITIVNQYNCRLLSSRESLETVILTLNDTYIPEPHSVRIYTTVKTASNINFTVPLTTNFSWQPSAFGPSGKFWLPLGKGCVQNDGSHSGMCFAGPGKWREALSPESLPITQAYYRYGANDKSSIDTFSLPIVTLMDGENDAGVSIALSLDDPLLEVGFEMSNTTSGFIRELLRLGGGKAVQFNAHIVGHRACWRPGLQYLTTQYSEYFNPWVKNAADFEGLGSYSWNQEPYNVSQAQSLGFKTNWDLSGTWMPYDGLFLPYQDEWLNLGPINGGLAQYNVTYPMINSYYERIQGDGFHSLSYFDIGNWGTRLDVNYSGPPRTCGVRPNGLPAPCPDPDGGNSYLRDYLHSALLVNSWSVGGGKRTIPHYDWVGTTDMDTMDPVFEDLIVEQLAQHLQKIPAFEGIAIDRLDYSEFFNYDADDGVSWIPTNSASSNITWGKARALRLSYRHTFNRLHEVLHRGSDSDKMMLINCNSLCRIDEFHAFDGSFSEGASLNSVAWTGIRQPSILWTYDLSPDPASLDLYFQQHLLMNVYPMAPMPKNDHSINPGDPIVEQHYRDYAKMFNAMHGARWLLSTRPASIISTYVTPREDNIRNPVTLQICDSSQKSENQLWEYVSMSANVEVNEFVLMSDKSCLGIWCCGCATTCCDCDSPDDGAQVAANVCHPSDPNPLHQNQRWMVSDQIIKTKFGTCISPQSNAIGSSVQIVDCNNSNLQLLRWDNNSKLLYLPESNPRLCVGKPSPPTPPPPATLVNVFILPMTTQQQINSFPRLLLPVMLGGSNTTATISLNLGPTEYELGWPPVSKVSLNVLHPGSDKFAPSNPAKQSNKSIWTASVPLVRGCALVQAVLN